MKKFLLLPAMAMAIAIFIGIFWQAYLVKSQNDEYAPQYSHQLVDMDDGTILAPLDRRYDTTLIKHHLFGHESYRNFVLTDSQKDTGWIEYSKFRSLFSKEEIGVFKTSTGDVTRRNVKVENLPRKNH